MWAPIHDPRAHARKLQEVRLQNTVAQEYTGQMMTASAIARRIADYEDARRRGTERQLTLTTEGMTIHGLSEDKTYRPNCTGVIAHRDDSFVRVIMGPYGSGKSTWAATEIIYRACGLPRWHSGRRRSRWGIVRNTSGELQSTTLATWLAWFGELGDIRKRQKPILTY